MLTFKTKIKNTSLMLVVLGFVLSFSAPSISALTPSAAANAPLTYKSKVVSTYRTDLYIPGKSPTALIVMLHGLYSSSSALKSRTALLTSKARSEGWIMAYPNGKQASWNAGPCCDYSAKSHQPDVANLKALIESLRKDYAIPATAPTILGGFSNGAMMTASFICDNPGMVDAAILDSGNLQRNDCRNMRVKNLLMLRGKLDDTVPINGTKYSTFLKTSLHSDDTTINAFKYGSTCSLGEQSLNQGVRIVGYRCGDRYMRYITQEKGLHIWNNKAKYGVINDSEAAINLINKAIIEK